MTSRTLRLWSRLAPFAVVLALGLGLLVAGCSDDEESPSTSTPQPTATPTVPSTPGGDTEVARIRAIAEALGSGDNARVQSVIAFKSEGAGAPPVCPAGVADGTKVEVFPHGVCEGSYLTRANASTVLSERLKGVTLYGAFKRKTTGTEAWPLGSEAAILNDTQGWAFAAGIESGKVVNVTFGCGASPGQMVTDATNRGELGAPIIPPAP
jgi:hypothetical protein